MACTKIIAEKLTLTGSIGVVTAKFNLEEFYKTIGYTKETLSKGKLAELDADQRGFTPEEEEYFASSAQYAYESFRNKAAASRNMSNDAMQEVAQGRVWSGKRALEQGLVDSLGGIAKAIEVAKEEAGMKSSDPCIFYEVFKPKSPFASLQAQGASLFANMERIQQFAEKVEAYTSSDSGKMMYMMEDIDV